MNVHGIHDRRPPESERRMNQQPNRQQPQQEPEPDNGMPWGAMSPPLTQQHINFAEREKVLLVSGTQQLKNPREENFWDMLMLSFCPTWRCLSLTMLIVIAELAMFIGQACYGINKSGNLLQISSNSLLKFGANYGPGVSKGEVYRLLSAIFVHINLVHLIGNMFATFVLVTRIQHTFGPLKTLITFLVSGIAGNIFSLAVDSNYTTIKAGASTSLHGMIGIILGYIIINWVGLNLVGDALKCTILCMFFFLIIFVLIFTPFSKQIDYFGHLGGFLAGIWLSAIHDPIINQTRQRVIRGVFVFLLLAQLGATFAGFYCSH